MKSVATVFVTIALGLLSVTAIAQTDVGISNCWVEQTPSPSQNVASYNVKLSMTPGGPYTFRVTNVPVASFAPSVNTPGDHYITCTQAGLNVADVPVGQSNVIYYLVTTAVNVVGEESGNSNETAGRLHVPPGNPSNARFRVLSP
jgi:hypothetical protein